LAKKERLLWGLSSELNLLFIELKARRRLIFPPGPFFLPKKAVGVAEFKSAAFNLSRQFALGLREDKGAAAPDTLWSCH